MDKSKYVYQQLDLGEYDELYRGMMVRVLLNPSYRLRREYLSLTGTAWLECVGEVLGTDNADVRAVLDELPYEVWVWLMVGIITNGEEPQLPYIITLWNRYAEERIKKHASRPPL